MTENVSIIVRALNESAHLGRLLSSISSQTRQPHEVILVDSGSTDGTVEIAESFGCRILHMPPSEFTFGRSLNWGCDAAKGDLLVFASAHVYALSPQWLERLLDPFETPEVGLVYGGQTGDHRSNFAEIQLLKRWFPEHDNLDQQDPFCNNANCAVRRNLWDQYRYDESLPGLEDLAFAKEIQADGHRVAYVADARIAHVHEEDFRQTINRYRREAMAFKHISGRIELALPTTARLMASSIFRDTLVAVRQRQFAKIPSAAAFRVAQYWGAHRGYRTESNLEAKVVRRMYYPSD